MSEKLLFSAMAVLAFNGVAMANSRKVKLLRDKALKNKYEN
jgi:hypothetical protein